MSERTHWRKRRLDNSVDASSVGALKSQGGGSVGSPNLLHRTARALSAVGRA